MDMTNISKIQMHLKKHLLNISKTGEKLFVNKCYDWGIFCLG